MMSLQGRCAPGVVDRCLSKPPPFRLPLSSCFLSHQSSYRRPSEKDVGLPWLFPGSPQKPPLLPVMQSFYFLTENDLGTPMDGDSARMFFMDSCVVRALTYKECHLLMDLSGSGITGRGRKVGGRTLLKEQIVGVIHGGGSLLGTFLTFMEERSHISHLHVF